MGAFPAPRGRPRMREDVRFVPAPDGVYLHSDHGSCLLRGRHAHEMLSRLAPVLDGRRTLTELTTALPDHQRSVVERLVHELVKHRMVVDDLPPAPHQLTESERRIYADEIAFIGYARDSPERRFQQVRQSRTILTGTGPLVGALVAAMIGAGWRDLLVVSGEPGLADIPAGCRRDPRQRVQLAPPGSGSADPARAGLVVTVASDPAELTDLCRTLAGTGTALAQVLVRPQEAWLAPVGPPERTGAESGWRRLAPGPAPSGGAADHLTGPVPAVIAGMVALACFAHLTGLDDDLEPSDDPAAVLTRVDLRNLDTRTHRFLRHPLATPRPGRPGSQGGEADRAAAKVARATVAALRLGAPLTAEEVLELAGSLVDARLGVLATLDEEALAQVPLSVCRARFRDPTPGSPAWSPLPEVVGWGEHRRIARRRALLGALAGYAHLATCAAAAPAGRTWGIELPDGAGHAVPLPPAGPAARRRPELPPGLGAGLSWDQAVAAGMRSLCEDLLGRHDPVAAGPTVALPDSYLARLVGATGEPVEIRDLTGQLDLPAYAFLNAGELVAVSAAASAAAAMQDGLERLLLHWQSRTRRQSAYRQVRPRWYDAAPATDRPDDPYRIRLLDRALRRCQQIPVAVPLAGDPAVARLVPYLVEVVLVHA